MGHLLKACLQAWRVWRVLDGVWRVLDGVWRVLDGVWRVLERLECLRAGKRQL